MNAKCPRTDSTNIHNYMRQQQKNSAIPEAYEKHVHTHFDWWRDAMRDDAQTPKRRRGDEHRTSDIITRSRFFLCVETFRHVVSLAGVCLGLAGGDVGAWKLPQSFRTRAHTWHVLHVKNVLLRCARTRTFYHMIRVPPDLGN